MASRDRRVQVSDLAAPDPIRPYGIQSDTYAAPPKPAINNDLENLQRGLAAFGQGMKVLGNRMERDAAKQAAEDLDAHEASMMEQYAAWRTSASSDEIVKAWRDGAVPGQYDPVLTKFMQKARARDEAEQFGRDLNADPEFIARIGTEDFDVDGYLKKKAAPYVERLGAEPGHLLPFSEHFERTKELAVNSHRENLSRARTAQVEQAAMGELERAVEAGISVGVPPDGNFTADVREIYKVLGPRMKGGAADVRYERLDELLLEVLEKKAEDPANAFYVLGMINEDRVSLDDGTTRLGPLGSVPKHADKVKAIKDKAVKALADRDEQQTRDHIKSQDVAAFERRDGSSQAFLDIDVPNEFDPTRSLSLKADKRREEATNAWLEQERARTGGVPDLPRELETFRKNNVKHPQFFGLLEAGHAGLSGLDVKNAQSPEQIAKVIELGTLYENMTLGNAPYVEQHLDAKALRFYEGYAALRRFRGLEPEAAAMAMIRTEGMTANNDDPALMAQRAKAIDAVVSSMPVTGLFGMYDFDTSIKNPQALKPHIRGLADALMRTNNFSADDAIDAAAKLVKERSVYVNGRAIVGVSGFSNAELPAAKLLLEDTFKANEAVMKSRGIESADDLSFSPHTSGTMVVVNSDGEPVLQQTPKGPKAIIVSVADFHKIGAVVEERKREHGAQVADKIRKGEVSSRWAPHNAIRGLFGYDPN